MTYRFDESESTAVIETVNDYYGGWYEANAERMASCLHPDLAKRAMKKDEQGKELLYKLNKSQMVERTRTRSGAQTEIQNRDWEITIIDIYEEIAAVLVKSIEYIEYLHLVKHDGKWKIVNGLYTNNRNT